MFGLGSQELLVILVIVLQCSPFVLLTVGHGRTLPSSVASSTAFLSAAESYRNGDNRNRVEPGMQHAYGRARPWVEHPKNRRELQC